jgi:hypothetical protein
MDPANSLALSYRGLIITEKDVWWAMLDRQTDLQHEPAEEQIMAKRPTRIITYAWGENYLHELLSLTLPALLAPGNLPSVSVLVPCELIILTEERFFATVNSHTAIVKAKQFCPVRLIGLDDLIALKDKYGMALTHALHRGFSDLGQSMTETWQIFLNADFILADGSLRNLLRRLASGERLVASPSYCVDSTAVVPELHRRVDQKTSALCIPPRELAALAIRYRHNTIRGKTVNERPFNIRHMDQFYWLVDNSTLLGHQMPIAIVGMRPERYLSEVNSYWDYGLMREFCPETEVCVLGDSDEFLMIELRAKEVAEDQIASAWPEPAQIAERMMVFLTQYQREFARHPLTLHAGELRAEVDNARERLRGYVDEVLSYLPSFLPSHIHHPQWDYHLPGFMESRHKFLSARLGSLTETTEAPASLPTGDRIWWELDGIDKTFTRKQSELQGSKNRLLELVHREITEIDNDELKQLGAIDEEFTKELAIIQDQYVRAGRDNTVAVFSGIDPKVRPGSLGELHGNDLEALVSRYEEKFRHNNLVVSSRKKALNQILTGIGELCDQRIRHLEVEYESKRQNLENSYQEMLQRRVLSAATPYVRLYEGPAAASPLKEGMILRGVKKIYQRIFGKPPRVTQLSCYWAPLRHLVRVVDEATARGARNVLVVGAGDGFIDRIADHLPGIHAVVSMSDLKTGNLLRAFDRPPQFDLCICKVEITELDALSTLIGLLRPVMSKGGTIVGLHLNYEIRPLTPDSAWIDRIARSNDVLRCHFAGSAASARVIAKFQEAARSSSADAYSFAVFFLRLLKMAPQALHANWAEAAIAPINSASPPSVCTSVTIEVIVDGIAMPEEFEGKSFNAISSRQEPCSVLKPRPG